MLKWILATCVLAHAITIQASTFRHTGELIYKLKTDKSDWGIKTLRPSDKTNIEVLRKEMLKSGLYEFVSYNTRESLPNLGERTDLSNQWHHEKIHTAQAWMLSNVSKKVIVAVCDSGVQPNHEDLSGQVLPGVNLITDTAENSITTSHGTFVAGLIAAKADSLGVVGVAPFVKILPLRISDELGGTSMDLILKCIKYGADAGAKVINVSFTGINNPGVEAAGQYARQKGALLVYAAGNQGFYRSTTTYPDFKNVLAVGASDESDSRWKWYIDQNNRGGSNYGPFVDLMAPGHMLYSTTVYDNATPEIDKYRTGSGTSYSAPLVSAVAALLFSVHPNITPNQVEKLLIQSADSMGSSNYYGAGRVNAGKALEMARKIRL